MEKNLALKAIQNILAGAPTVQAADFTARATFALLTDIHVVEYRIIHVKERNENLFKWNFRAYNVISHCKRDTTFLSQWWIRQVGNVPAGHFWVWSFPTVDATSQNPFYKLSYAIKLV